MWQTAPTFFERLTDQLELYVRQAAWLNTVPEKASKPRYKTSSAPMPPLEGGAYIAQILFDVGPARSGGMGGLIPIEEVDLAAWQSNRDLRLSGWEAKTIRRLSAAYAAETSVASKPNALAPYTPSKELMSVDQREKIAKAMGDWADKLNAKRRSP